MHTSERAATLRGLQKTSSYPPKSSQRRICQFLMETRQQSIRTGSKATAGDPTPPFPDFLSSICCFIIFSIFFLYFFYIRGLSVSLCAQAAAELWGASIVGVWRQATFTNFFTRGLLGERVVAVLCWWYVTYLDSVMLVDWYQCK